MCPFYRPIQLVALGFAWLHLAAQAMGHSGVCGASAARVSPVLSNGGDVDLCNVRRVSGNVIETVNFRIYGFGRSKDALKWAAEFERMRRSNLRIVARSFGIACLVAQVRTGPVRHGLRLFARLAATKRQRLVFHRLKGAGAKLFRAVSTSARPSRLVRRTLARMN